MIQIRDSRGNYHETLAIYDNAGREIKEVRNNQGRLLFKNWNEIHGSVPLSFMSRGAYLQDYRIYGNTVQNGTPTPENPVEVQGCGEYDAELNGYKIPVTVSNGTNSITTPVFIGSEPLHKIYDYADYVDFERGVVVRNIKKIVLTGDENWIYDTHNTNQNVYRIEKFINFRRLFTYDDTSNVGIYRCDHILYVQSPYPSGLFDRIVLLYNITRPYTLYFSTKKSMGFDTAAKFKLFLAEKYELGQPVTIWYIAAEPEEEPLENLLPIQTIKGSDVLTAGTAVQPSEIYIKGKIKSIT